jgi:hypothetical protein
MGRALLPLALTRSANYDWLYASVCLSPTIKEAVSLIEGKVLDAGGKVRKVTTGRTKALPGDFLLWSGSWELFDLPAGVYSLEVTALSKTGQPVTSRNVTFFHGRCPSH